jgi:hypothetical protein
MVLDIMALDDGVDAGDLISDLGRAIRLAYGLGLRFEFGHDEIGYRRDH